MSASILNLLKKDREVTTKQQLFYNDHIKIDRAHAAGSSSTLLVAEEEIN